MREWWQRLADARLSQPQRPAPVGRGWSTAEARVVVEELVAIDEIQRNHLAGRVFGLPRVD